MSRYQDPDSVYSLCKCVKAPTLRWDPHPECMYCIYGNHYMEVKFGLGHDGEPDCTYCAKLRRFERAKWADEYKARVLDPANYGYTSSFGHANANANANVTVANRPVPLDHMAASNEGEMQLQPSGVVSEHQGDWDATPGGEFDELSYDNMATGEEPEAAMDEGDDDVMEIQPRAESSQASATPAGSSDGAAPPGGPDSLPLVFKQVFQRASKAVLQASTTGTSVKTSEPVFEDFPRMAAKDRDTLLPAFPAAESFYKRAEADSSLRSREAMRKANIVLLTAEVSGLSFKEWKCPIPEKEMLANSPVTRGLCRDQKPKHPTQLGAAVDKDATNAWYASQRAANLLSCAGMLTSYLRRLSDTKAEASHFVAMEAASIDSDVFNEVVHNSAGMAFLTEVEKIADAVGGLILSAMVDVGTSTAAVTLCRRRLWLDSCGLKDTYLDQWMKHPTPSGGGLFGATTERVAAFKTEQASKEVLQKEMAYMVKQKFTPHTPGFAGRGANSPGATNTMRGVYQARAGRGKSRAKFRGNPPYNNQNPKATGSKDTDDKTAKPDNTKKKD